jgi:glycine reductase
MPVSELRVVLFLNQFFGQLGGEEAAAAAPRMTREVVGPGRALEAQLAPGEQLVGTLLCGDNYFAEHEPSATEELLAHVRTLEPDIFLAGPAFNAGRYGVACGALCAAVAQALGIPSVAGMFEENPGVELYRRTAYIVRTGESARDMRADLGRMLALARRLARGEPPGKPAEQGYFARGRVVPELADKPAAERAVEMLLAKLAGAPFHTEVELPRFQAVRPAPPLVDVRRAVVALVTDGGLVPAGNPDGIENRAATKFGVYSIEGRVCLDPADYTVSHLGYDTSYVKADPNRLVPVDVARELEREGAIGRLHGQFLSTTGIGNPIENSRRLGREMGLLLQSAGVDAVILTST